MRDRPPTEEVTRGLETKSAKIRALAKAGYNRAEIAQILGIRYQHVRNVLVTSGIAGGLRRGIEMEREPVTVDAEPAPREDTSWEVLRGFRLLGEWPLGSGGAIKFDAKVPIDPGVYAFVVDDIVRYVGLTNKGLRERLFQYQSGHKGQKTNARVKALIADAVTNGHAVKVFVSTPEPSEWNNLPVNTAAGLEAGLIQMIRPAWNIMMARRKEAGRRA
jgi:hypothetical protein